MTTAGMTGSVRSPEMGKFIEFLRRRKAETDNQKHVAMLELLIEHTIAEVWDHDLDRTMATLIDDCVYHNYGDRKLIEGLGFPSVMRGSDEVRAFYSNGMEAGIFRPDAVEVEPEHLFVSDDAIAWDGFAHLRLPGAMLAGAGMQLPEGGTADDEYVMSMRCGIVIPFRDGLIVGEDFYYDGAPTLTLAS